MKILSLVSGLSIAGVASIGFSSVANAANFVGGDTLNFTGSLQLDNRIDGDNLIIFTDFPATLPSGGADPVIVEDFDGNPDYGQTFIPTTGTGGFSSISGNTTALVKTFGSGGTGDAGGDGIVEDFLIIDNFVVDLDLGTVDIQPTAIPGSFSFDARGTVLDTNDGTFAPVEFVGFTAQGLFDDAVIGDDVVANDSVTGIGSYSGTQIVVIDVPEPATTAAFLLLGGLAAGGALKRKKFS